MSDPSNPAVPSATASPPPPLLDTRVAAGESDSKRILKVCLAALAVLPILFFLIRPRAGLELQLYDVEPTDGKIRLTDTAIEPPPFARYFKSAAGAEAATGAPNQNVKALYSGTLRIDHPGTYFFWAAANGVLDLKLDGASLQSEAGGDPRAFFGFESLNPGLHSFELEGRYENLKNEPPNMSVRWGKDIAVPLPLTVKSVYVPDAKPWRFLAVFVIKFAAALAILLGLLATMQIFLSSAAYRRACLRFAALGISVLVFAIGAELMLRIARVRPREYVPGTIWLKDHGGYNFEPGHTSQYMGWLPYNVKEFEVPVTINAQGWRDHEYPYKKPEGTYRILVLGDSYVEAKEVPLEETFHKRLEKRLNVELGGDGKHFEVIAMGKGASTTSAAYEFLFDYGLKYDPDLVIVSFFPGNDVRENSPSLTTKYKTWIDDVFRPKILTAKIAFIDRFTLFKWSYLNHFIVDRLCNLYISHLYLFAPGLTKADMAPDEMKVYQRADYDAEWQEAWKTTKDLMVRTRDLAVKNKADFMVMIAHSIQVPGLEADRVARSSTADLDITKPNRIMREFCAEKGIECLDTEPALTEFQRKTGKRYSWRSDAHWNENGHSVVADVLFDALAPRLGKPTRQ